MAQPLRMKILLERSEIVTVINHVSGYGNTIVDGREKNRWLKSNIDHYYQGFSEQSYSSGEDGWFIEHVRTLKQVFYYTHCDYLC